MTLSRRVIAEGLGTAFLLSAVVGSGIMVGGFLAGTVITLIFLPALYVAWFRVKEAPVR